MVPDIIDLLKSLNPADEHCPRPWSWHKRFVTATKFQKLVTCFLVLFVTHHGGKKYGFMRYLQQLPKWGVRRTEQTRSLLNWRRKS